jgi:hypothetical protein
VRIYENISLNSTWNENISGGICTENPETFLCSLTFSENPADYEMVWKNWGRTGQATNDSVILRMRFACSTTKDTDTQSEYVILMAFSRQMWLR